MSAKERVLFFKTVRSKLNSASNLANGIYFATDTKELILSSDGSLMNISSIEELATESERENLLAPLNKFYFIKDSSALWYYNGTDWQRIVPVVNDLDTDDSSKPLSASMGKKLNDEKLGKNEAASKVKNALTFTGYHTGTYDGSAPLNIDIPSPNSSIDDSIVGGQVLIFDNNTKKIKSSGYTIATSVPSGAKFTDTVYTHPTYTPRSSGLYKVTVDNKGHVSEATAVTKDDIVALGIPGTDTNTTYGNMRGATDVTDGRAGLVPAPLKGEDTKYLCGDGTWSTPTDTIYTHPDSGVTAGTYKSVKVDKQGHVISGSNPTTLSGYGITDAASKNHTHDASSIVSGTFDLDRIPKAAIPNLYPVADDTARLALTTNEVQNGDTVKVLSSGKMYYVVDDSKLNSEDGYEPYTADVASSVPWSGVTGKPSTFTPSSHTHTKSQITDFPSSLKNPNTVVIKLNSGTTEGTNMFTYDGSSAKSINITPSSIGAAASGHTHTKSQITDFPTSMPASDVSAWAKASTKPTYTPTEVGVIDATPTSGQVAIFDGTTGKIKSSGYTIATSVPSGAKFTDTVYTHPTYTAVSTSGLYKIVVDNKGHVSSATAVTKADITALGIPGQDTNTTYNNMTGATTDVAGKSGLVPAPSAGAANRYLRSDGTWVVPPNTTYSTFKGATSSAAGGSGLVPTPASGDQAKFLRADATWQTISLSTFGLTATATELNYMDGVTSNVQTQLNNKAASSHTHNYAGSSSAGGSANSVANSIVIKLNGGSTEGTNLFTFNGSAAKTINITPASIGAAASSHGTHVTYSTNAPKANGTASAGSSGAVARADHVHPLQTSVSGSSGSCTGNAATATKATQDSAGQQINTTYIKGLSVNGKVITYTKGDGTTGTITTQDTDTNTWRPLGTTADTACAGNDSRLSNARPASDVYAWAKASSKPSYSWGEITGKPSTFTPSNHTHNYINSLGSKNPQTGRTQAYGNVYSYNTNASAHTGAPTTYTSVIGFGQGISGTVEIAGEWTGGGGLWSRALRDCDDDWYSWQRIYTDNYHPNANTATRATQDSAGQQINTTYIKGLSVSGRTITYTKGDGSTGTITTQDTNTTYSTGTASALGLTKLYTGTGSATDGTMTQSAITSALNGKLPQIIGYYGSDTAGTSGWYKVCSASLTGYNDIVLNLLFTKGFGQNATGILHIHIRCNGNKLTIKSLLWMYRYGFSASDVRIVTSGNTWNLYVYQESTQYGRIQVQVLSKCGTSGDTPFSLSSNTTKESSTPGGTAATDGATVNNANSASNSDMLDGYHEYAFLRHRWNTSVNGENTLWGQIGIKQYNNAYPDSVTNKIYEYGEVISLPSTNGMRFDIYVNDNSSHSSYTSNGIQYRSGWNDNKKPWRMILDEGNYKTYCTPANIGAATSSHSHSAATTSAAGFLSASDKSKLDGLVALTSAQIVSACPY